MFDAGADGHVPVHEEAVKKSVNEEKASPKGAETQRLAKQIKQLFFRSFAPWSRSAGREAVNFYPDSEADGLVTARIVETDLGHVADTTVYGVEGETL